MIIYKDKSKTLYNSEVPDGNFGVDEELIFIVDDVSQLELSEKIRNNYPYIDFVVENNSLVDIVLIEKPKPQKTELELLQECITQLEVLQVNTMPLQIETKLLGGK